MLCRVQRYRSCPDKQADHLSEEYYQIVPDGSRWERRPNLVPDVIAGKDSVVIDLVRRCSHPRYDCVRLDPELYNERFDR